MAAQQQQQQLQQQQYYYQQQYPQQQQGFGMPGEPIRYFELEQAVQELRPLVIQVLNTQMYHNSTAAVNLRRGIRQVREICKQLRSETVLLSKQKKTPDAAAGVPAVVTPTAGVAPSTNPSIPDAAPSTNAPIPTFAHAPIPGVAPHTSAPIPGGAPASSAPLANESTPEQPAKRPKIETNPATAPSPPCDQPPRASQYPENLPKTSIVGGSPLGRNFIIVPDEDTEIPASAAAS